LFKFALKFWSFSKDLLLANLFIDACEKPLTFSAGCYNFAISAALSFRSLYAFFILLRSSVTECMALIAFRNSLLGLKTFYLSWGNTLLERWDFDEEIILPTVLLSKLLIPGVDGYTPLLSARPIFLFEFDPNYEVPGVYSSYVAVADSLDYY